MADTSNQPETKPSVDPQVGAEKEKTKRVIIIIAVVILLPLICCGSAFMLGLIGSSGDSSSTNGSSSNTSNSDTETSTEDADIIEEETETEYKIGEAAPIGDIEITVKKVENLGNSITQSWGDPLTTQGRFIRIDFDVENVGTEPLYIGELELVDSQGRTFAESEDRFMALDDIEFLDQLNPNVTESYATLFDVPSDASDLKLKVSDWGLFTSEYVLIDLTAE